MFISSGPAVSSYCFFICRLFFFSSCADTKKAKFFNASDLKEKNKQKKPSLKHLQTADFVTWFSLNPDCFHHFHSAARSLEGSGEQCIMGDRPVVNVLCFSSLLHSSQPSEAVCLQDASYETAITSPMTLRHIGHMCSPRL